MSGEAGNLFENGGNENHWIGFRLRGNDCNVSAIGARVVLDVDGRSLIREVAGGRGCCQEDMTVHFGLGAAPRGRVNASILWPHGRSQYLRNLKIDRYHLVED